MALVVQQRSGLAFALTMGKINTFMMNTSTLPFFAAPGTSSATSCSKSLPSFAAPNTPSATSCAAPFTCGVPNGRFNRKRPPSRARFVVHVRCSQRLVGGRRRRRGAAIFETESPLARARGSYQEAWRCPSGSIRRRSSPVRWCSGSWRGLLQPGHPGVQGRLSFAVPRRPFFHFGSNFRVARSSFDARLRAAQVLKT